jgi:hypothetical protein
MNSRKTDLERAFADLPLQAGDSDALLSYLDGCSDPHDYILMVMETSDPRAEKMLGVQIDKLLFAGLESSFRQESGPLARVMHELQEVRPLLLSLSDPSLDLGTLTVGDVLDVKRNSSTGFTTDSHWRAQEIKVAK